MRKLLLSACLSSLWAAPLAAPVPASLPAIQMAVKDTTLANGLRVLLLENHQSPLVSCRLFYATGSVHESPGHAGLAHMLEHMLFKGTQKVGVRDSVIDARYQAQIDSLSVYFHSAENKGDLLARAAYRARIDSLLTLQRKGIVKDELWTALQEQGGTGLNAFTTDLATAYFVTLPKEKTELFLWLEADRMQNAVLREFLPERDVVREERRMRYDDSPYGRYYETLSATFFESHPYRIPTIGWPSDIEHLSAAAAQEHYRKYYKPNNAILVMVGDFKSSQLLPQIIQYFGSIPRGEAFPPLTVSEPDQVAAKTVKVYKDGAKSRMDLLFHAPAVGTPGAYALELLAGALGGQSGVLYRELVQKGLAVDADASFQAQPYHSTFSVEVELKPGVAPEKVEAAVWDILNQTQQKALSARDLQKVKNQVFAGIVRGLSDLDNAANQLGFWELYGSWKWLRDYPQALDKISPAQILTQAQSTFQYEKSTTGWLLPLSAKPFARPSLETHK